MANEIMHPPGRCAICDRVWLGDKGAHSCLSFTCQCLDCGWKGPETSLKAQACPCCDGRVADIAEVAR